MSDKRQPWMKWYGADWRADPCLRMCGYAARGLWADLLSLMQEATPFGHLLVNGRQPSPRQLAGLLGGTAKEVEALLEELAEAGVFSRTEDGVIYSRRMVRDREKEDKNRQNGKQGGNPKLRKKDNPDGDSDGSEGKPRPPPGVGNGVNPSLGEEDKAQKPEARSQRPESSSQAPEHSAARGEGTRYAEIGERVVELAGIDPARWTGNYALVGAWLGAGYDPELDIYPAVQAVAKRAGYAPPRSLNYFSGAIEQHYRTRMTDIPAELRRGATASEYARALEAWTKLSPEERARTPRPRPEDFAVDEAAA